MNYLEKFLIQRLVEMTKYHFWYLKIWLIVPQETKKCQSINSFFFKER